MKKFRFTWMENVEIEAEDEQLAKADFTKATFDPCSGIYAVDYEKAHIEEVIEESERSKL